MLRSRKQFPRARLISFTPGSYWAKIFPNAGKSTAYSVVVGDGVHTIIQFIDLWFSLSCGCKSLFTLSVAEYIIKVSCHSCFQVILTHISNFLTANESRGFFFFFVNGYETWARKPSQTCPESSRTLGGAVLPPGLRIVWLTRKVRSLWPILTWKRGVPSMKRGSRLYDLHWRKEFWFLYSSLRKKEQG